MARPKKTDGEAASTRLINALWDLLETKRLTDITVGMITDQAGLNRGTFYYHFDSLDALVEQAIESEMLGSNSIMQNVFGLMVGTPVDNEPDSIVEQRLHKIALLIKQGGIGILSSKVKSLAIHMWQAILCEEDDRLAPETLLVIEYATSGIIGIVAHNSLNGGSNVPKEFYLSFIKRNSEFLLTSISEAQNVPRDTVVSRLQTAIRFNLLR